ncbi:hypothetical protein FQR65_LT01315 [Abscondita terminalis]|nr:hypothetical protein FQR65_LT01315 [Abscondita terminalis]
MWHKFCALDYKIHLIIGFLVHIALIEYGRYHDDNYEVPFTDIDYTVFTDAARYIAKGMSPYARHTYRYSPLIAILLIPNLLISSFGKYLFSVIDLAVALLIRLIVIHSLDEYNQYHHRDVLKLGNSEEKSKRKRKKKTWGKNAVELYADASMMLWLYNPMTIAIATRGSCDSIAGLFVLSTIYFLQVKRSVFIAGIVHGVAVHIRLYPIAYSLALFMHLSKFSFYSYNYRRQDVDNKKKSLRKFATSLMLYNDVKRKTIFKFEYLLYLVPNFEQAKLIIGCLASLGTLTGFFYVLYGYQFLHETYIYHLIRRDTRHNFSMYFYLQYLTADRLAGGVLDSLRFEQVDVELRVCNFDDHYGRVQYSSDLSVFRMDSGGFAVMSLADQDVEEDRVFSRQHLGTTRSCSSGFRAFRSFAPTWPYWDGLLRILCRSRSIVKGVTNSVRVNRNRIMKHVLNVTNKWSYQYAASFSAILITGCSGLHFGWTSPFLPILLGENSPIPMTNEQSSWVATIYLIAGPCGALAAGLTLNVVGRKPLLITSSLFFFVSWLMLAFGKSLSVLLLVRFIAGVADGLIFGTTPVYIAEIVDKKIRGFFCSLVTIAYMVGVLVINVLGTYMTIRDSSLVCAIVPVVFFLIFIWMPESPNYYLAKGETEKAQKSLAKLRPPSEVDEQFEDISKSVEEEAGVTFFNFCSSKVYRKSLFVVMTMRGGQQLSGIAAIIFYAQTVFEEATDIISPLASVVILYTAQIAFAMISSVLVDRIGRRPLLIGSVLATAMALFVEGTFFYLRDGGFVETKKVEWLPIAGLVVFVVAYSMGLQIIPLFIVGEIFPIHLRPHASAFSDVYYFLFAFLASKFFQATKDAYGMHVSFFTFCACTVLNLLLVICFVPETKKKSLHEIQLELNGVNNQ